MEQGIVYLDESGDLGWTFDKPYRAGGSSRYLTIAGVLLPAELREQPKRVVRRLYKKFGWSTQVEKKWAMMTASERVAFCEAAVRLREANPEIKYLAITVRKENVVERIRKDENKLYNYMIKLLIAERVKGCGRVTIVPDERSIKVKSGNSLHDYLQTVLWFDFKAETVLTTNYSTSSNNLALQFSDMLAGVVNMHWEDGNSECWKILGPRMQSHCLFF